MIGKNRSINGGFLLFVMPAAAVKFFRRDASADKASYPLLK
jgi:hypothetical protein